MQTVVIRVDSSILIGAGHVMRCLTLANELRAVGRQVIFIGRELPGNLLDLIEQQNFLVYRLPYRKVPPLSVTENPYLFWLEETWQIDAKQTGEILKKLNSVDLLIVDHYALDIHWESAVQSFTKKLMVIDDLANRKHQCDFLLDQSLYANQTQRYQDLVPAVCRTLFGAKYALLREEFVKARANVSPRQNTVQRILIFLGGADPNNFTSEIIKAGAHFNNQKIEYDVVVGKGNPHRDMIESLCAKLPNFNYHCQVNNMAELMTQADLSIGAGGGATWERCCLGLPAMLVSIGPHDEKYSQSFAAVGAVKYMGRASELDAVTIAQHLTEIVGDAEIRKKFSETGFNLVDGLGVKRVVQQIGDVP